MRKRRSKEWWKEKDRNRISQLAEMGRVDPCTDSCGASNFHQSGASDSGHPASLASKRQKNAEGFGRASVLGHDDRAGRKFMGRSLLGRISSNEPSSEKSGKKRPLELWVGDKERLHHNHGQSGSTGHCPIGVAARLCRPELSHRMFSTPRHCKPSGCTTLSSPPTFFPSQPIFFFRPRNFPTAWRPTSSNPGRSR